MGYEHKLFIMNAILTFQFGILDFNSVYDHKSSTTQVFFLA